MKALRKYKYVKLQRNRIPKGKGIMGSWMHLLSRAAFRKGNGSYCGFRNPVTPGMWAGGIVGLKSILGVKRRPHAMYTMSKLEDMGYISYDRDLKTKKFTYEVKDYVQKYTGGACEDEDDNVYATEDYGFVFVPRDITQRLVDQGYVFEELDAWLDLWVHTVFRDYGNAFSFLAPAIQYGKYGSVLTLETLGKRWGWEKTKVWRFFKKFGADFALYRLPGTYGCVICNLVQKFAGKQAAKYPTDNKILYQCIRTGFTVLLMYPIMCFYSNIINMIHFRWTVGEFLEAWISKMPVNWIFAFCVQIWFLGPINRFLFRTIFKKQLQVQNL